MTGGIYKKGQGYWTRTMSAVALGTLVLMGVAWLWDVLAVASIGELEPVYVQGGASIVAVIVIGLVGWWLIGRNPRSVDFMIATEGELKKVNWSSRREVLGSTWVVIGLTIFVAIFCLLFDLGFQRVFTAIGVLKT